MDGTDEPDGPDGPAVVCGIDGSRSSTDVLAAAARSARDRHARLRVVAAFEPPDRAVGWSFAAAAGVPVPTPADLAAAIRKDLAPLLAAVRDAGYTGPAPEVLVVPGSAAAALCAAAAGAAELVVGHHGRGRLSGIGSVALGCVLHAPCPVTVVPGSRA